MRLLGDRVGALAHAPDACSLGHRLAPLDGDGAELEQRDRMPVVGSDRQRPAAVRHGSDERDRPSNGGPHRLADRRSDVDSSVLPARVRVGAEAERPQERPFDRPRPPLRTSRPGERTERADEYETLHASTSVVRVANDVIERSSVSGRCQRRRRRCGRVVTLLSQRAPVEVVSGHARQSRDELGGLPPRDPRRDELGHGADGSTHRRLVPCLSRT